MSDLGQEANATDVPSPDLLSRALTPKQILLGFFAGALLLAAVIGMLVRDSSAPPRFPETPASSAYSLVEDPRDIGLSGDRVEVEGELVARDYSEDLPVLWISGEQFGTDPESDLPYAVPLRVHDSSELTSSYNTLKPAEALDRLLDDEAGSGPVRLSGTVRVLGHSVFVVSCVVDDPSKGP